MALVGFYRDLTAVMEGVGEWFEISFTARAASIRIRIRDTTDKGIIMVIVTRCSRQKNRKGPRKI